jgi:hypothetical protein
MGRRARDLQALQVKDSERSDFRTPVIAFAPEAMG